MSVSEEASVRSRSRLSLYARSVRRLYECQYLGVRCFVPWSLLSLSDEPEKVTAVVSFDPFCFPFLVYFFDLFLVSLFCLQLIPGVISTSWHCHFRVLGPSQVHSQVRISLVFFRPSISAPSLHPSYPKPIPRPFPMGSACTLAH